MAEQKQPPDALKRRARVILGVGRARVVLFE